VNTGLGGGLLRTGGSVPPGGIKDRQEFRHICKQLLASDEGSRCVKLAIGGGISERNEGKANGVTRRDRAAVQPSCRGIRRQAYQLARPFHKRP
jgi:hypothetical protein